MATGREPNVAVYAAPEHDPSTVSLLGGIVNDIQDLVRKEIALVRQETIEELGKLKTAGIALVAAGVVLAVGGLLQKRGVKMKRINNKSVIFI